MSEAGTEHGRPAGQLARASSTAPTLGRIYRHVVLIGLSGSGKSTVGRILSRRLGVNFVDTDELVVRNAGTSIPDVFRRQGESAFRTFEAQAVERAVAGQPSVIATGGGAPVDECNRRRLWAENFVVWLDASVEALATRVGEDGSGRPLLAGDDRDARVGPAARLTALRAAREPIYANAHARIDTERLAPQEVAEQIIEVLERSA